MAPCPNNALAVQFHGLFALIYTDDEDVVSWLNFSGPEGPSATEYTRHNAIQPDSKATIHAKEGQIALVMFLTDAKTTLSLRVYYIQKGQAGTYPDGSVREVNASIPISKLSDPSFTLKWSRGDPKTGGGDPTPSAFDLKKYKAADRSPLAAVSDGPSIRVYFRKEGSKDLTVAYATGNTGTTSTLAWADRPARTETSGF